MFKVYKKEIEVAGKKISLETGKIARQADGAIIATCGETVILATAVGAKKVNPEVDYFPLSVNYQEKYYAGGKIPGGYFKREARPTESETLISRLIDRPIRPLFPDEFKNEVQLLPTVISYDKENEADILSIIASSAALAISGLTFLAPTTVAKTTVSPHVAIIAPSACLATLPVSKLIFFPATSISFFCTLNISFPFRFVRFVPFRSIYLDFYFLKFNFDSTFL